MGFKLRQLLIESKDDQAALIAAVEGLAEVHGKSIYQQIFTELLDKQLDADRASRYWKEALVRWDSQKKLRGAKQSVKTALLDYLQSVVGESNVGITDGLTGLYSQAYLMAHLEQFLGGRKSNGMKARHALVVLGLDHPEQIRSFIKPFEADQALRKVAGIVKETARKMDTAAALNDGTIGLLIGEAGQNEAYAIAERIRTTVNQESFAGDWNLPGGQLTVSCGIAICPEDGERGAQLLLKAQTHLKRAAEYGNSTSPRSAERRKGNRQQVCAMVEISDTRKNSYVPAMAYDISRNGMAIGCDLEVSDKRTVSVRFRQPYWSVSKDSKAIVRQSAPHDSSGLFRLGLEFIQPETDLYQPFAG